MRSNAGFRCLVAVCLLLGAGAVHATSPLDPCFSTIELHASTAPVPLFVCPQGDTESFTNQGWWISLYISVANNNGPAGGVPGQDIWLVGRDPVNNIVLCLGSQSSNADAPTDLDGNTTISNSTLAGGGCGNGLAVVIQGWVISDPATGCTTDKILPINVRSPDLDGSMLVDLVDLSMFATHFPPHAYESCSDFNLNGVVDLQDLSRFAAHFGPPGHRCGAF